MAGSGDPLPLNIFDLIFIAEPPIVRFFSYRFPHPTADFIGGVVPALKASLSATLHDFYPLAGKICYSGDNLVIRYEDGDSVPFTLAEYYDADDFDDISGYHDRHRSKFRPLFSHLESDKDGEKRLLAVQVTVFPNAGFVIAVTTNHAAIDGRSVMHFMRSWASACRAAEPVDLIRPSFDRSTVKLAQTISPRDFKNFFENILQDNSPVVTDDNAVLATFKVSKADIEKLKQRVSAVAGTCSSFSVTSACAWVSLLRARGYNNKSETRAVLNFSADCRARLSPRLPPEYLGNCLKPCFCEAMVSDLMAEDGVEFACELIQKTVKQLSEGEVMEGWEKLAMFAAAEERMSVNGSPRFGAYDTDFGWGKPVKVDFPVLKTGCIALLDCGDEQGGIEFEVALTEKEMKEFRAHFMAVISLG
ncbi:hypothetical protein J5N97_021696 [Dioscorea zingiberensis]|uniref:Uncharacterized protein n=1 Tax=Dioscorea zingiberensis TaxID=325984 RepID=A0A9D5C9H3_9LILI|nr:hypothetical protein J5N97_021696 [Dioscorea zingiberensis]